jgi:hypothetical protein
MYFALELNGKRRIAFARKGVGISEVTIKAFGPQDEDARVIKATPKRGLAENALFDDAFENQPLKEVA